MLLYRNSGGDCHPQATCIVKQCDRPHGLDRVRNRAGQSNPQFRVALRHRQPQPAPFQQKRPVVEADWKERTFAAGKAGALTVTTAPGRFEPGIRVPAHDRSCSHNRQLTEVSYPGQLPAQRRIACDRRTLLIEALGVAVQQPSPDVSGRPQQPVAAVGLAAGYVQPYVSGPMHEPAIFVTVGHIEHMFAVIRRDVNQPSTCAQRILVSPTRRGGRSMNTQR
jgi:hypothetical protein